MDLNPSEGIAVFTDGSAYTKDRSGGWAWVALDSFEGIHTASGSVSDTTISRMELTAVTDALCSLYKAYGSLDVLVYSDSEYVVLGNQDRSRKRVKNRDCWEGVDDSISLHNTVTFEHVKGHSDSVYNEMADQLAGKARRDA